jgi:hypothetical protein
MWAVVAAAPVGVRCPRAVGAGAAAQPAKAITSRIAPACRIECLVNVLGGSAD